MSKSLITKDNLYLENIDKKHKTMLKEFTKDLPMIQKATSIYGKTQSQFMDNMLTVSHPTPIRNARQILSEINRSWSAFREAYLKNKEKLVELKIFERDLEKEKDSLQKELIKVKIMQKQNELTDSEFYIKGAIRKITNYRNQYKNILKSLKVKSISEIDFETEEEKYHIMKAFDQGLCAARSRGGLIDEGNLIYLSQVGVNGTVAQKEMLKYLNDERKLVESGKEPTKEMDLDFLNKMYEKFKGCSKKYCEIKGMELMDETSVLGDEK